MADTGKKAFQYFKTAILKPLIATILYIIIQEAVAVWIIILEELQLDYDRFYVLIQGIFQLMVVLVFIVLIYRKALQSILNKTSPVWYLVAAGAGIVFVFLQSLLKWIYNIFFGTAYYIRYDFDGLGELGNISILSIIVFIPLAEELFFRRYIQGGLQKRISPWAAIAIASLSFALIHAPYSNLIFSELTHDWHLFYLTIFGGLISGIIYFRSRSVGPSIVYHMFWNLTAVLV